jgi:hypothetical protein
MVLKKEYAPVVVVILLNASLTIAQSNTSRHRRWVPGSWI